MKVEPKYSIPKMLELYDNLIQIPGLEISNETENSIRIIGLFRNRKNIDSLYLDCV